jgi:predicted CoA-binding protein
MSDSSEYEADLLRNHKTLVVVGLSSDPSRASYRVSAYMQQHGYRIVPVNPNETEVLGERCYPTLADVPGPVEFVDVFRRAEACPEVAREAVAKGAKVLWLQLGIVSPEARQIAEDAGIDYVEDRCVMVVHRDAVKT